MCRFNTICLPIPLNTHKIYNQYLVYLRRGGGFLSKCPRKLTDSWVWKSDHYKEGLQNKMISPLGLQRHKGGPGGLELFLWWSELRQLSCLRRLCQARERPQEGRPDPPWPSLPAQPHPGLCSYPLALAGAAPRSLSRLPFPPYSQRWRKSHSTNSTRRDRFRTIS